MKVSVSVGWLAGSAVAVGIVAWAGCAMWKIPERQSGHYKYADEPASGKCDAGPGKCAEALYTIPAVLLSDPQVEDAARDCAVAANLFRSEAQENMFWSTFFGFLQVGGASVGTVAGAAAFENGPQATAAKISVISFGIATAFAAVDSVYKPGKISSHQEQVSMKLGHLILLAAAQMATGDKKAALASLSQCQDPADVNDATTVGDIDQLVARINELAQSAGGTSGTDGGTGGHGGHGGQGGRGGRGGHGGAGTVRPSGA
jgi:hypothetical protein